MAARLRFRDILKRIVPWWLSERRAQKKTVGFRFLWSMVAMFDVLTDVLLHGMKAAWPGAGTSTALPYIGRGRGVLRGQADTNDEFAAKCRAWLERAERWGSMHGIAGELHDWLGNHPRIRVVNRSGRWFTLEADGTITETQAAWDWDSVTNPERAGFWSELWIIVYPTQWALSGTWGDGRLWGGRDSGIGHRVTRPEVDAVKGLIAEAKSAGSRVRAVIWTSDATLFDPAVPLSCPNGTWGTWGMDDGAGSWIASGRNTATCRYWEPSST